MRVASGSGIGLHSGRVWVGSREGCIPYLASDTCFMKSFAIMSAAGSAFHRIRVRVGAIPDVLVLATE